MALVIADQIIPVSAIIIKLPSFFLVLSLCLIFHTNSVFSCFFSVFSEEKAKIAHCRQSRPFIHVTYIRWYFNIANELLAFHYDGIYYYFHFSIYCLSIFYYSFYFITTLWLFYLFIFPCRQRRDLRCTSCTLRMAIYYVLPHMIILI